MFTRDRTIAVGGQNGNESCSPNQNWADSHAVATGCLEQVDGGIGRIEVGHDQQVGFALESAALLETAAKFLRHRRIAVHLDIRCHLLDHRMGGTHSLRSMLISSRSGQTDDSQPLESPQWPVGNAVLL